MAVNKTALPTECSPKSITSLIGAKTLSATSPSLAYKHGSVMVVELAFNDSTTNYIKFGPNSALEIGGTLEMGTGTQVTW
jgi:hypothetical protein